MVWHHCKFYLVGVIGRHNRNTDKINREFNAAHCLRDLVGSFVDYFCPEASKSPQEKLKQNAG